MELLEDVGWFQRRPVDEDRVARHDVLQQGAGACDAPGGDDLQIAGQIDDLVALASAVVEDDVGGLPSPEVVVVVVVVEQERVGAPVSDERVVPAAALQNVVAVLPLQDVAPVAPVKTIVPAVAPTAGRARFRRR